MKSAGHDKQNFEILLDYEEKMSFLNIVKRILSGPQLDGQSIYNFWDSSFYYPSWLYNGNEHHVWPVVEKSIRMETRHDIFLKNGCSFTFLEKKTYEIYDDNDFKNIELYFKKEIVSSFDVISKSHFLEYDFHSVEFIKEGEWQKLIKDFLLWKKEFDKLMDNNIKKSIDDYRKERMNKKLID